MLLLPTSLRAQSTATLQGQVFDASDATISGATVRVRNPTTGFDRSLSTDVEGRFRLAAIPAGTYTITAEAAGFRSERIEALTIEVGRTLVRDFRLAVGDRTETVAVSAELPQLDRATMSVGTVVTAQTTRDMPLNGRHFVDLALLVPGSVTPPQGGAFAPPSRGQGSFAINSAGGREDSVNFMVNGINVNNQSYGLIIFQPNLDSIQEFKIDNSTFSAESGRSSAAIVNIATRSGTNAFHGELFDFLRDDALDASNHFNVAGGAASPFRRNQLGGHLGGPIVRNALFFFVSYERLRQRQGLDINSVTLSGEQRASTTSPVVRALSELMPRANYVDETGTPRWIGYASAPVDSDQWSADISYNGRKTGQLHGYFGFQNDDRGEPRLSGNTLPGFGDTRTARRRILTINHIREIASGVNEARAGLTRFGFDAVPNVTLNPASLGIRNGIDQAIGVPQFNVSGAFNVGGPATLPSGRTDTTITGADTMSWLHGAHSVKLGGEFRYLFNNNYNLDTGLFNFPTIDAFLAGTANSFTITLGDRTSHIRQGALGLFVQDTYQWRSGLSFELGLRYEWNMSPTERDNRFVVFDAASVSLKRVGVDVDEIYAQNHNIEPRLGVIWNPSAGGRTVVRGAYAVHADQPLTNTVIGTTGNPPNAVPLAITGPVPIATAIDVARAAGLAPQTVDPNFRNARVQSFNVNVQRQLTSSASALIGYIGSRGARLRLSRNINQPIDGIRPYTALSPSSPILPGTPVGNIIQLEGTGESAYDALWVRVNQRLARGFQFNTSYTWAKSLDFNSLSTIPVVVQDGYNVQGSRGLSDFDARHRLVASAIYRLPFRGTAIAEGWQIAATAQFQSGNPLNLVTANSTINGVANTIRPNVTGPIRVTGDTSQWFDTSVFQAGSTFGNLGRNVVIGPGFGNVDVALSKDSTLGRSVRLQLRVDVFNALNQVNFGQPGRVVGSVAFGRITNTRFPAGDAGSARQVQLAIKLGF